MNARLFILGWFFCGLNLPLAFSSCDDLFQLAKKRGLSHVIADYYRLKNRLKEVTDDTVHSLIQEKLDESLVRIKNTLGDPNLTEERITSLAEPSYRPELENLPGETLEKTEPTFKQVRREIIEWAEAKLQKEIGNDLINSDNLWEKISEFSDSALDSIVDGEKLQEGAREMGLTDDALLQELRNVEKINEDPAAKQKIKNQLKEVTPQRVFYRSSAEQLRLDLEKALLGRPRLLKVLGVASVAALTLGGLHYLQQSLYPSPLMILTGLGTMFAVPTAGFMAIGAGYSTFDHWMTWRHRHPILKSPIPPYPSLLSAEPLHHSESGK